jgi:ferredoxin
MSRPLWFANLLNTLYPARFLAARLTRLPGLDRLIDRIFFNGDDILYLPKDNTLTVNTTIPQPESIALPSQVVEHFIRAARYHFVMDFCLCRRGENCQEYPQDIGCLFLGEAVLQINPRYGRLVTQAEALAHVRRARAVGLVHMIGRNRLDTLWLGAGPGSKLLTICNCCPCCCLWGTISQLHPNISQKISRMPGVSVAVNGNCAGCSLCAEDICFVDAIQILDGRAVISPTCRGCGRCVDICPTGAIELTVEGGEFVENTIRRITPLVDVG